MVWVLLFQCFKNKVNLSRDQTKPKLQSLDASPTLFFNSCIFCFSPILFLIRLYFSIRDSAQPFKLSTQAQPSQKWYFKIRKKVKKQKNKRASSSWVQQVTKESTSWLVSPVKLESLELCDSPDLLHYIHHFVSPESKRILKL